MKRNRISLKWNLFVAILLFAAIIVFVFIIFQIGLLDRFYLSNKIDRTTELINEVTEVVNRKDIEDLILETNLSSDLEKISLDEETAIYLYAEPVDINNYVYNPLTYKTITGTSFDKLTPSVVNQIWTRGENTPFSKFYAVLAVNPDPMFDNVQILDVKTSNSKLTRALSEQNDSLICCSFIRMADNKTYLLVLDNKIVPVESAVDTLKMQLTYISIIIVIFAIVIAIIVSKYISSPISVLNSTAKKMAKGDYDVTFEGEGYLEINELNETLNNTVAELKKTETLRRELMANVSHDLRTPLTMINGYAEMMRDLPGENNSENLQIIIDEVNRLNILVSDMMNLSKISSRTIELHKEVYSITDNLIEIIDRYQKFKENSEFKFELTYDKNVNVEADESKIDQVIYNFINNAINYSGKSNLIEIKQICDKDYVTINIIDHGVGIKKEDLEYIWDRYYRIDNRHKRSIEGSGLGLAIVKGILDYHNFEYGVNSIENEGSTFWFKMKIKK